MKLRSRGWGRVELHNKILKSLRHKINPKGMENFNLGGKRFVHQNWSKFLFHSHPHLHLHLPAYIAHWKQGDLAGCGLKRIWKDSASFTENAAGDIVRGKLCEYNTYKCCIKWPAFGWYIRWALSVYICIHLYEYITNVYIKLLESPIPAPPPPPAAAAPSQKASSDDISGTKRGTIDPLVSKQPEKIQNKKI